ncbi:hypothetical protein M7I_3997 [Glarea lozoyensis 74030]|uniref:Fungal N-terminal domain-containing protein n=1 Tax=Glarea lozoyensis (strain ATCC 74030 / MF5533) TaxID=1104152 RepID=H0EMZ8_GLAL7|nr:hypothetical protein M7I_3997 [Glarea lozoyensis 74030]
MDPVTILGAVGSVVGIAAFGFKLAQFVEKTFEEFNAADATLRNILHNVKSISYALNEIEQLLRQERENLRTRGKAVLFSPRAIHDMQSMTDKCVEIFWYIEGTIARTEKPRDLEDDTEWDARQRLELEQEFEILNRQKAVRYEDVPVHERPVLGEKQGLVGLNGRAHEPFSSARSNERASYDTRPTRRQRANSPPPQKAPPTRKERVDRQDSQVSETPETKLAAHVEALRSSTKRAHSATPPPDNSVPQVDGACLRKPDAAGDGAPSAEEGEFHNKQHIKQKGHKKRLI